MDKTQTALPIFLGACEKAARRGVAWDLLGISSLVFFPFLPCHLNTLLVVFAWPIEVLRDGVQGTVRFKGRKTGYEAHITVGCEMETHEQSQDSLIRELTSPIRTIRTDGERRDCQTEFVSNDVPYHIMPMPCPPYLITVPEPIDLTWDDGKESHPIGAVIVTFVKPQPISEEERRALRSNPVCAKALKLSVTCNSCGDSSVFVSVLDESDLKIDKDSSETSLADAPDEWQCKCGKASVPLVFAKDGVPALWRKPDLAGESLEVRAIPFYEGNAIDAIVAEYSKLISGKPLEEEVQEFIECNPLLWSFLSPKRILHKPKILTKKVADFGILSENRELYLIEIEKPQTRLCKKNGGRHSEVQAGLSQITDWRIVVNQDRRALLNELGFEEKEVHVIKYILVAGLLRNQKSEHLMRLRHDMTSDTEFYTFDELAKHLMRLRISLQAI